MDFQPLWNISQCFFIHMGGIYIVYTNSLNLIIFTHYVLVGVSELKVCFGESRSSRFLVTAYSQLNEVW